MFTYNVFTCGEISHSTINDFLIKPFTGRTERGLKSYVNRHLGDEKFLHSFSFNFGEKQEIEWKIINKKNEGCICKIHFQTPFL